LQLGPQLPLLLIVLVHKSDFGSQFDPQMCFSLVNLVHKITNRRGIMDVFAIWIYSRTNMTASCTSRTKIVVCPYINTYMNDKHLI
jgi:hypothetical protein